MENILEYKCPNCGGKLEFDSASQNMKCPYCDSEFDMEALKEYDEALKDGAESGSMEWEQSAGGEWTEGETDDMAVYVCKSCGGEIVGDKNMGATSCPFCGNPVVIMGKFAGDLKPDKIIPFKLDKNAAKAGLASHLKGKTLLPKVFKDQNHIDEIKGIYVPFWLFDADAAARVKFKAEKIKEWNVGKAHFKEIKYYSVTRAGNIGFDKIPVDGSSAMPDDLMESLEPFDNSQAVDFQTAYFAGYLADRYDVDAEKSVERANQRVRKSAVEELQKTVTGFDKVYPEQSDIQLSNGKTSYAMYPVWLLNTTWNGNKYTFAMNGQTGKFVGNLPMDKGKFWLHMVLTFVITVAAVFLLGILLEGGRMNVVLSEWRWPMLIGGGIVTFIRTMILRGQLKSVAMQENAQSYIREGSFVVTERDERFLYKNVEKEFEND